VTEHFKVRNLGFAEVSNFGPDEAAALLDC